MLELIVWCIVFSTVTGIVLVVHYWYDLIRQRDTYTRGDLVDFLHIYREQLGLLTSHGSAVMSYAALGIGVLVAWLLTLFGGLVSPNSSPAPDFAGAEI